MKKNDLIKLLVDQLSPKDSDYEQVRHYLLDYYFPKVDDSSTIADGSLVLLEQNNIARWYFILAIEGGKMLNYLENIILTITPFSPLGSHLIDKKAGQIVELKTESKTSHFKILQHR